MKRIWIITLVAAFLATGCNQGKLKELETQNQSLKSAMQEQDSLVNDFMASFNAFEENLIQIKERENLIAMNSDDPELRKSGKEQVLDDLQTINELLAQNRQIIDELNEKLEKNEGKIPGYKRLIARLKTQIQERDTAIFALKTELEGKNFTVAELNTQVETLNTQVANLDQTSEAHVMRITEQDSLLSMQGQTIAEQLDEMHKAYIITGTFKELKEKQILTATGGFLGIGRNKEIRNDFDESGFQEIDITEVNSIPVDTRKAKIVSSHPTDSYTFLEEEKRIASLEITDPDRFWKNTKYLVVVVN